MSKREHVPETQEIEPNRQQRRHPDRTEDTALARDTPANVRKQGSQDVANVRAKSSGHGKKTADKWNQ